MWLWKLLHPPPEVRTPALMQIAVSLQALALWASVAAMLHDVDATKLVALLFQAVILVGLWKMRRWAAIAFALLTAWTTYRYLVTHPHGEGALGAMFGLSFRATPLLASLLFWDRMTWRGPPVQKAETVDAAPAAEEPVPRGVARMACASCGAVVATTSLDAGRCARCASDNGG